MTHTKPTHLLWLDYETTGSRLDSRILEYAVVLTTADLDVIYEDTALIRPHTGFNPKGDCPPVVYDMHNESGLWDDLDNPMEMRWPSVGTADVAIFNNINNVWSRLDMYTEDIKIRLAGSGVSHFDSLLMRQHMPATWSLVDGFADSDFLKPTVDMGVVRRVLQLFDLKVPDTLEECDSTKNFTWDHLMKPHRAYHDVILAIEQARWFRRMVNRIMDQEHSDPWATE